MAKLAIDFTHGQHVRVGGFDGPRGKIYRCRGQRGDYWKVKLQSGAWVYPTNVVADTDGPCEQRCAECGIPFRSEAPESLCPQCDPTGRVERDLAAHAPIRNLERYRAGVKANAAAATVIRPPETRNELVETTTHPDGCLCGDDGCTPF